MGRVIDEMNYQGDRSELYFACDHTLDYRSCPVCCGDDEDEDLSPLNIYGDVPLL